MSLPGEPRVADVYADDAIRISVPAGDRQQIDTIVALELDRTAMEIALLPVRISDR